MASPPLPALLLLHYQNEVLHPKGKFRFGAAGQGETRERVVRTAQRLLAWTRARHWPVIHVRIAYRPDYSDVVRNCAIFRTVVAEGVMAEGSWGAEFLRELRPSGAGAEFVVTHNRVNAFYKSSLPALLEQLEPPALVVGGIATNSVVEHTVRHATDMGFESVVIDDACGAASAELHEAALRNLRMLARVMPLDAFCETQEACERGGGEPAWKGGADD